MSCRLRNLPISLKHLPKRQVVTRRATKLEIKRTNTASTKWLQVMRLAGRSPAPMATSSVTPGNQGASNPLQTSSLKTSRTSVQPLQCISHDFHGTSQSCNLSVFSKLELTWCDADMTLYHVATELQLTVSCDWSIRETKSGLITVNIFTLKADLPCMNQVALRTGLIRGLGQAMPRLMMQSKLVLCDIAICPARS